MAAMAKWGPKEWVVSTKKVVALEGLNFSYTQVADNNDSTEEKKTTNERGTELFPLSFTTKLHAGAGVDIRAEIESWQALVTKVYYFLLGGKKLGPPLQLRKVSVSDVKLDDRGRMRLATLSFEFKEYNHETTSVPQTNTVLQAPVVTVSDLVKAEKKNINTAVKTAGTKGIVGSLKTVKTAAANAAKLAETAKKGSYVRIIGNRYSTGETIPTWVKKRTHEVSQIKPGKVLLGHPNGINSWVNITDITLV